MLSVGTVSSLRMATVASCSSFSLDSVAVDFNWTHGQQRRSRLCEDMGACDDAPAIIAVERAVGVMRSGTVVLFMSVTSTVVPVLVLSRLKSVVATAVTLLTVSVLCEAEPTVVMVVTSETSFEVSNVE